VDASVSVDDFDVYVSVKLDVVDVSANPASSVVDVDVPVASAVSAKLDVSLEVVVSPTAATCLFRSSSSIMKPGPLRSDTERSPVRTLDGKVPVI
jgi:hypothetical protein